MKEKNVVNRLDLSTNLLFNVAIMNYEYLVKFKPLNLDPYDGTKNPINHI